MTSLAIITGASTGIGLACARAFIKRGTRVICLSRRAPPDEAINHVAVDLSAPEQVGALEKRLHNEISKYGATGVCLVHNASAFHNDNAYVVRAETLQPLLELNVVTPARINAMCLPLMPKGSSIVFMGSTLSEKGVPDLLSYVTAKHAMVGLMRATCQDLDGKGIHTACLCPGFVETEMLREKLPDSKDRQALASRMTLRRLVTPEEIADAVVMLSESPVFNGAVLHANLGQVES